MDDKVLDWEIDYVCPLCGAWETVIHEEEEKPNRESIPLCPNGCCRMQERDSRRVIQNKEIIEDDKLAAPAEAPFWNHRGHGELL